MSLQDETHAQPQKGDSESESESLGAQAESATGNLIGTTIDEYQILRRLGRGGMADVYVAMHRGLERQVALKVLRRQLSSDESYVERFRREARAAAKLNHPNIVHVYEIGRSGDTHYIAQELIDGGNLKDAVEQTGPLAPDDAINVLRWVASALAVAHQAGITHRDIKPDNLLRSSRGEIKVADFGLARVGTGNDLTQVGLTMGTPRYMSPEQVQGKPADARSDLYSLGCTMFFLLTGRPPFEAEDSIAIAVQHMHETPPPIPKARGRNDVPDWLIAIVMRMMAKSPLDRFASADEIVQAVAGESVAMLVDGGGTAQATVLLQRAMMAQAKVDNRRRLRRLAAVVAPVTALGLGLWFGQSFNPPSIEKLLKPDLVRRKSTIEEQYLAAASRDDVQGWQAVAEYFPSSGDAKAKNAAYEVKANLQLARLLVRMDRAEEAKALLIKIADNADVDRLYQVIALAELVDLPGIDIAASQQFNGKLRQAYKTLIAIQPDAENVLRAVMIPDRLLKLQSS